MCHQLQGRHQHCRRQIHQHDNTSSDASSDFADGSADASHAAAALYWGRLSGQGVLAWSDPTFSLQWSDRVTARGRTGGRRREPVLRHPGPGNAFYQLRK
jgi:hypothetical protein